MELQDNSRRVTRNIVPKLFRENLFMCLILKLFLKHSHIHKVHKGKKVSCSKWSALYIILFLDFVIKIKVTFIKVYRT